MKLFIVSRLENIMEAIGAMLMRNHGRPLLSLFIPQARAAVGEMRLSFVKPLISYLYWCNSIARKQGLKGLVLTLKALNTSLAQSIARDLSSFPIHPRIRRGRLGLPTVIPILHRIRIAEGDPRIIRYWFTLFSLYRVIEFPGTLKISSITNPGPNLAHFLPEWSSFMSIYFWPGLVGIGAFPATWEPLKFLRSLVVRPYLIAKSTPSNALYLSTSFIGLVWAGLAWLASPQLLTILRDWIALTKNTTFSNWFEEWLSFVPSFLSPEAKAFVDKGGINELGKLGLKDEPAGKIRVFAMVDPFTQWLMKPLHDFLFSILRKIPQDGTFDQLAPVRALQDRGKIRFWSFDLSSATDRLPVLLQAVIMSRLITAHGANLWMALLTGRTYALPIRAIVSEVTSVRYAVGQPMGALTSWAILALTHHALIQYSAYRAGKLGVGAWFSDYAVLGDDVVIADRAVAHCYLELIAMIGVEIQLSKSVRDDSGQGVFEFAKRVFYRRESVGPVPLLEVLAAAGNLSAWLELVRKYELTLSQGLMILGFGYQAVSRVTQSWSALPRRIQGYVVSYYGPGGPRFGGDLWNWISSARKDAQPDDLWLRDLLTTVVSRVGSLIERARLLTKLVEVDRTRAHYGTSKWESWQLPKMFFVGAPEFIGANFPKAVKANFSALWLLVPPEALSQAQLRVVMRLVEYVYRDSFFDLLSELRGIERALVDIQENGKFDNLPDILSSLESLEKDMNALGLSPSLTIRKAETTKYPFVRGGVWLRRWRSWMKANRSSTKLGE